MSGRVVEFPPLPPVPVAPRARRDGRQAMMQSISERIGGKGAQHGFGVVVANTSRGFPASAVDVGRLQEALERGLGAFDMRAVRRRWPAVREWVMDVAFSWIQRCKMVEIARHPRGPRITLETQDDRGYYRYRFDVFPGRLDARGRMR